MVASAQSYPFCPNCVHYYVTTTTNDENPKTKPNCSLLKKHPLFKDRPDVDFIGREICTTKGKYWKYFKSDEDSKQPFERKSL